MVSPFGLQASTQCNYSYNNLSCAKVSIWNGIFSISEDATLVKIDYNRGEADLKHRYCILGHCEQIHTNEYRRTRLPCKESKEEFENNPQVYTTQEGIGEIKNNPQQVYTTQEGMQETKNNPQVYTTQEGIEEIEITLRYTLPKKV